MTSHEATQAVRVAAEAATKASPTLVSADDGAINSAVVSMSRYLNSAQELVLEANREDLQAAEAGGMSRGLLDRLRLDEVRLGQTVDQLCTLAAIESEPQHRYIRDLDGDLMLEEWRRPVGVIGANFEARPGVVIDIASQLIKSRNAGVLRTGSAALRTAGVLIDEAVAPALTDSGLASEAIQLVRVASHDSADALVQQPDLLRLVILRGSGDTTRNLSKKAAVAGVKTLAHADGGSVVYLHESADAALARSIISQSLDRLAVCNRLNLLLIGTKVWEKFLPEVLQLFSDHSPAITASLPPHAHPIGYEWALDSEREASVTLSPVDGVDAAARVANDHTSGLAAAIVASDGGAAQRFLQIYAGTGAFWNATPRLLDGFKLLAVPETGINVERTPGLRGPITFRDLYLRQYVVRPRSTEIAASYA
jgi:glutamate-5-semialdehyde dehydrogenase